MLPAGVVLVLALVSGVWAGPDGSPIPACRDAFASLPKDVDRKALRHAALAVQQLHAIASIASIALKEGLQRLEGAANLSQLEAWLKGNQSVISKLDRTRLATTCLTARLDKDAVYRRPQASFLLNYFKRPWAVKTLAKTLLASCNGTGIPCEVLVNVDNPHEASAWAKAANASEGFLVPIFSANLHESRGYNRVAKAAKGKMLIIWQDDQTPPSTHGWLQDLSRLFDTYPSLGVVGMNCYRLCSFREPTNRRGEAPWEADPKTGIKWSYAQNVDFAPFVARYQTYHDLGGLDEGVSRPGDCGITGDWEITQRAWSAGWQVGFYDLQGRGDDGHPGGTHSYVSGEKCWGRQMHVGGSVYHRRYGAAKAYAEEVCTHVWKLNLQTFKLRAGSCPYGNQDTSWPDNCTLPTALSKRPARKRLY